MTTPEGRVKARLYKALKELATSSGGEVWSYCPNAGPFGTSGIPDRIVVVQGQFVGVECKADKSHKPTALQTKCMADITRAGGTCFVVYDDQTIEDVKAYIWRRLHDTDVQD